ncbi:hypothetical protein [Aliikangiella sp. IMCC44359]|uniref:hypothetical protein n=1 Tax=Aliikangiella sp. IMCC44359 TaxID=3459125 RepID=UPI00403B0C1E
MTSHKGKSPMDKYFELNNETPYSEEVAQNYDPSSEHVQLANYQKELALKNRKDDCESHSSYSN